jgi:ribonuclease HI
MQSIIIYTDGGARGNPGIAGVGAVIFDENEQILGEVSEYLGDNLTNNYAEYEAIVLVLKLCLELGLQDADIELRADSKLVVEQLSGRWKVKDVNIRRQFNKVKAELKDFKNVKLTHVRRELNKHADALANKAMDSVG